MRCCCLGESGSDFLFDGGEGVCACAWACVGGKRIGEHVDDVERGGAGGVEALPLRINDRSVGVLEFYYVFVN